MFSLQLLNNDFDNKELSLNKEIKGDISFKEIPS